jgi:hypothetical protein
MHLRRRALKASTIVAAMLAGCGGPAATSSVSAIDNLPHDGGGITESDGTSAASPPDGTAIEADAREGDAPYDCCPPGDYFVEVIGAVEGGEVYRAGPPTRGTMAPAAYDCVPTVPWSYANAISTPTTWGIYACASGDTTRHCIYLDNGNPTGGGRYVDANGVVWSLRHPGLSASGNPPTGEYTASALTPEGAEYQLHGRFKVCPAFLDSFR